MLDITEALKQLREEREFWETYDDEVFFPALKEASKKLGFQLEGEANGEFAEVTTIFDADGNFEPLNIENCEEKYKTREELVKAILSHFGLGESLKEGWKEEKDADRAKFLNEISKKGPITFVKLGSMSFAPYFTSGWNRYKCRRYQHTDLHNGWARQKLNYPNFYILLKNDNTDFREFAIKISPKCFNDLKKKETAIKGKTYDNWEALNNDLNLEIWDYTLNPERIAWDDRRYEAGGGFNRIADVGAKNSL